MFPCLFHNIPQSIAREGGEREKEKEKEKEKEREIERPPMRPGGLTRPACPDEEETGRATGTFGGTRETPIPERGLEDENGG